MGVFDLLSAAAVSFTVAGNTGISPFLTLFLVGLIEKAYPDALNMDATVEVLLSSWEALSLLAIMTILEFVGKCIPVLDEIIDSVMTFVIPIMASLGTLSTFGLYNQETTDASSGNRELRTASNALLAFQIFVLLAGIGLAFAIHALKMLIRVLGEGWLTNCIAILEVVCVVTTITMAIFIKQIAIVIAFFMCSAAIYSYRLIYQNRQEKKQLQQSQLQQQMMEDDVEDDDYVRVEDDLEEPVLVQGMASGSEKKEYGATDNNSSARK